MANTAIAIVVNDKVYTRRNNDAELAGTIVSLMAAAMPFRYKKAVESFDLTIHYNFVEVPDRIWPYYNILKDTAEFLNIPMDRLMELVEVRYFDNIQNEL